ncbi:AIPR family protein [Elstera cyanobacteriorum]|uniref:AIPR family protein n=1 Tax=Elstera cyanobacteriorum TaxID=2022747 RepID=UPI002352CEAD|nr:AIPR family protein [Elstera cyanobacteriorum]MCK6442246.1 AIPR family protein [Elstera cyanobacteriorum]
MLKKTKSTYDFAFSTCRNISCPDDDSAQRKVYSGHAPITSVLGLNDHENVREYLVEARGKQKHSPTLVHQAIRKTLKDHPEQFSVLNGGMVIVAHSAELDDKTKILHLNNPSIINGSQTQGELKRYVSEYGSDLDFTPNIKYEIIVTTDEDLIAEISIARNFQNDVRAISIAGRRGQLDQLEIEMQKHDSKIKLRKSETDLTQDDEFLDTEKLIQVIFALLPEEILAKLNIIDPSNKVFAYSQKTRCLKLYQKIVEDESPEIYNCFPDGIVFPIIAAYSAFVRRTSNGWKIQQPKHLTDKELINSAAQAYMEIAGHNPQTMGKSKACYSSLYTITSIYAKLEKK